MLGYDRIKSQIKVIFMSVVVGQDTAPSGFSSGDVLIPLADEYDPMFPNDYEKVVKRHREERQRQREQERQKEIEEREKYRRAHKEILIKSPCDEKRKRRSECFQV